VTLIRSAGDLQRLYARYLSAPSLKTSARRPGEWLVVPPESDDARVFAAAFGVAPDSDDAEDTVRALGPLNGALGVVTDKDVRLVVQRVAARSTKLELRFTLVKHGASTRGAKPTPRAEMPTASAQLDLHGTDSRQLTPDAAESVRLRAVDMYVDLSEPWDDASKGRRTKTATDEGGLPPSDATTGGTTTPYGDSDDVAMVLPDGSPIPDLSSLLTEAELADLWRGGKLNDANALESLFEDFSHLIDEMLEDEAALDLSSMADRFRAQAILASGTPSLGASESSVEGSWADISASVVEWTQKSVRLLREGDATGHLFVLSPSPGTGKSHGMMVAAEQEQNARRKVGYAVLSRAQIPEASDRLLSMGPNVRLIVIEGRHERNCWNFDQVNVATDAGFSPGRTVCPSCEFYPKFGRGPAVASNICPYFASRREAVIDRALSDVGRGYMRRAPAIILTTHAAAIQGSHIATRRNYTFWNFDTLFIDEDPTSAMVTQSEIGEESMTYSQTDDRGHVDGPTRGTMLLRDAMKEALRLRAAAEERGFVDSTGAEDRVHSRFHGSSFAGAALHALLESVAMSTQGLNLRAIGSLTIDGMTEGPPKGEIMSLTADEVAARYPNRHLLPIFSTLEEETVAIAEARAAGTTLEPAYRVHLDLVPDGEDGHRAVLRVHQLLGYANGRTNIIVGDAYADTVHYEGLFDRHQRDGKVQVIKHRAVWPPTSTLVRIVTHAGSKHITNTTQLIDHLEQKVRPVLELERGRRIVFYIHKAMKDDFVEWIESVREELDVYGYAVEHWGSGRGKDTYKNFDTFIAVTEYVPNIGALVHEANTVAALAAPGNTRVGHWSTYAPRSGSTSFANSLLSASPFFQAAFHRKATDELAQAVHRIRPAIPSADGCQKRAYVFGHQVPWTDELVAATSATAVVDNGKEEVDLETQALGIGTRFSISETLGLVSAREVAGAIWTVFRELGCWSHVFAHAMIGVPSWASIEEATVGKPPPSDGIPPEGGIALITLSVSDPTPRSSPISERVVVPPNAWTYISDRVRRNSRVYRAGLNHFLTETKTAPGQVHRASWMPSGSKGYEFWGDRDRFDVILAAYSPAAKKVPF
jgi:hypothetical protein